MSNSSTSQLRRLACVIACLPALAHCSEAAPAAAHAPQALSNDGPASDGATSDSGVSGSTGASGGQGFTGNFSSRQCETVGDGTYQLRHYAFGTTGATATWVRFSNAVCSVDSELMSIVMVGTVAITGPSTQVTGANDVIVSIATKTVTPNAAGLAIVQQACGEYPWQAGAPQTITTGCGALLQQTNDCPAEYDLAALTMVGIVFGDRSHPLCSEATRPTELSKWSVLPDPAGYVSPPTADGDAGAADPGDAAAPTEDGGSPSGDASPPQAGDFAGTYACTVSQGITITAPLYLPNAGGLPLAATMVVTETGAAVTATLTGDRGLSCALSFTDNGDGTATLSPGLTQTCSVMAENAFGDPDVPVTLTLDMGGTAALSLPSLDTDNLATSVSNASLGVAGTGTLSADCTRM
jgi:hypothetical protein